MIIIYAVSWERKTESEKGKRLGRIQPTVCQITCLTAGQNRLKMLENTACNQEINDCQIKDIVVAATILCPNHLYLALWHSATNIEIFATC